MRRMEPLLLTQCPLLARSTTLAFHSQYIQLSALCQQSAAVLPYRQPKNHKNDLKAIF